MMDNEIRQIMVTDKAEADDAYGVVFLNNSDHIEEMVNNPLCSWRGRKVYSYASVVKCEPGDIVVATCGRDGKFGISFALVLEKFAREVVSSSPDTGMIINRITYLRYLKDRKVQLKNMEAAKEKLRKRIELEKEKIVLQQLKATNPELFADVEKFRELYPEESLIKDVRDASTAD